MHLNVSPTNALPPGWGGQLAVPPEGHCPTRPYSPWTEENGGSTEGDPSADLVTPGHQTEGLGPAEAPELRIAEDSDFRVF